ncbi:MAG: sigma-54 interaction domain-containing protein [bacterium]
MTAKEHANKSSGTLSELQSLHKLALAITSASDLDSIINTILEEATALTHADHGSILLSKDETIPEERFTTLVRHGSKTHEPLIQKSCMMFAGWVLKNRKPLFENDILQDHRFKGLKLIGLPLKSVLAVPIQTKGEIIGVLVLHTQDEHNFTENDMRVLNIIASQSAPVLENARLLRQLKEENVHLRKEVERKYSFTEIVGRSPAMDKVFKLLEKIIPTDARVLIQGESGTGKELIARAIHYNGPRKNKRFVAIDCGALPENLLESELFGHVRGAFTGATESKKGLFQVADAGTIFLDEINNTSSTLQAKLLRVIQESEVRSVGSTKTEKVDVRIITAASKDLTESVREGAFREDLFFRLKVVTVKLPPLRDRREDILILAEHFLKKYTESLGKPIEGLSKETVHLLQQHPWPGNVRELENTIEHCVVLADPGTTRVDAELLPEELHSATAQPFMMPDWQNMRLDQAVEQLERLRVTEALKKYAGNRTKAAKSLGLSRRGLLNKIERYGLED